MRRRRLRLAALSAVVGVLGAGVRESGAQTAPPKVQVGAPLLVSPAMSSWYECSVAVSQTDVNDVLAVASNGYAIVQFVSGVPTIYNGTLPCGTVDPGVVAEPFFGGIFVTGMEAGFGSCPRGVTVGYKSPGATTLPASQFYTASPSLPGEIQDKPWLAIGPAPGGGGPSRYYLLSLYEGQCGSGSDNHRQQVRLTSNPMVQQPWAQNSVEPTPCWNSDDCQTPPCDTETCGECDWLGWGAAPVVLDSGRVVVAMMDWKESGTGWMYNSGLPYVVYSDDGGVNWQPDDGFNPVRVAFHPLGPVVQAVNAWPPSGATGGETPHNVDRRKTAPDIAYDGQNRIYVAFYAKAAEPIGNLNADLCISASEADPISFPGNDSQLFLRITDEMLGLTPTNDGPDQFVPAIALDSCGGINLMYYDNRHAADPNGNDLVDVYFARITGFGTPNLAIEEHRLTPASFSVAHDSTFPSGFLGDYHKLAVSADGRTIYAAYIGRESDGAGGWTARRCYLHKIRIYCPLALDFTGDGAVTDADAAEYLAGYGAAAPEADLDLNWRVDQADFTTFLDWYAAESGG